MQRVRCGHGLALGEQLFELESPVAGDQEQLTPPDPLKVVEDPAQIAADPVATAVGEGLTGADVVATGEVQPFSVAVTE